MQRRTNKRVRRWNLEEAKRLAEEARSTQGARMTQRAHSPLALELGEAFRIKRIEMQIEQRAAAKIIDVGPSTLSQIEQGSVLPQLDTLIKAAALYGITISDLVILNNEAADYDVKSN